MGGTIGPVALPRVAPGRQGGADMMWPRALLTTGCSLLICAHSVAQQPGGTITNAHASVTVKGHVVDGALTYDRVGDLTLWGPGGGMIDLGNEKGDAFQYSAMPKAGTSKTTA